MGEPDLKRMTVEEFCHWQLGQDRPHELVDGLPVLPLRMMTGTTRRHDRIVINAIGMLLRRLDGGPCRPWTDAVGIRIPQGNVRRPDVSVDCGTGSDRDLLAVEPNLVMEVLSPSTMTFDRIVKLGEYKRVETLCTILLVDTELPQVTVVLRDGDLWQPELLIKGLDASIGLAGLDFELPMTELYEGILFDTA